MLYQDDVAKIREIVNDAIKGAVQSLKPVDQTPLLKEFKDGILAEVVILIDAKLSSLSLQNEEVVKTTSKRSTK